MTYTVRKAKPEDENSINKICYRTSDKSGDTRYKDLVGLHWAVPYLRFEADHCFVVTVKEDLPVGYILASVDAQRFRRNYHKRMKTDIRRVLEKQRHLFSFLEYVREYFLSSHYMENLPAGTDRKYPAHLHIDIDPEHQGQGLGSRLMDVLLTDLRGIQCPGVHLGVGNENSTAIRFYERYGFKLLKKRIMGVSYYGLKLL